MHAELRPGSCPRPASRRPACGPIAQLAGGACCSSWLCECRATAPGGPSDANPLSAWRSCFQWKAHAKKDAAGPLHPSSRQVSLLPRRSPGRAGVAYRAADAHRCPRSSEREPSNLRKERLGGNHPHCPPEELAKGVDCPLSWQQAPGVEGGQDWPRPHHCLLCSPASACRLPPAGQRLTSSAHTSDDPDPLGTQQSWPRAEGQEGQQGPAPQPSTQWLPPNAGCMVLRSV